MARNNHKRPQGSPDGLPAPLTVAECAALARVDRRTIFRWLGEGRFTSTRPIARGSSRRLVDRASFLAFLGRSDEAAA
jgi:excisionase family DNA binding protein